MFFQTKKQENLFNNNKNKNKNKTHFLNRV